MIQPEQEMTDAIHKVLMGPTNKRAHDRGCGSGD